MDAYRIVKVNKSKNAAVNLTNNVFGLGSQTLDDLTRNLKGYNTD